MSRSLKIVFSEDGKVNLLPDEEVEGFEAVCQNAIVNILTQNNDSYFPDRGIKLLNTSVSGAIFDNRTAEHAANFAALDTLYFGRKYDVALSEQKMKRITLVPEPLSSASGLTLRATFDSVGGTQLSYPIKTGNI